MIILSVNTESTTFTKVLAGRRFVNDGTKVLGREIVPLLLNRVF